MQQLKADLNIGADIKSSQVPRKSQVGSKTKKAAKKSQQFLEILQQLSTLSPPSIMEAKVKTTKNSKIPNENKEDYISTQLIASKQLPNSKKINSPEVKAKSNNTAINGARNDKLTVQNVEEKMQPKSDIKAADAMNKLQLIGDSTEKTINRTGKGDSQRIVSEITRDIPASEAKLITNIAAVKDGNQENLASSGIGSIENKPGTAKNETKLNGNMTEIKNSSSGNPNSPVDTQDNKAKPELDIVKAQDPKKNIDIGSQSIMEKSGLPIKSETAAIPESNLGKAALSNQMDSIASKMIQQIKVAPSSLEVSLKPEYLGKISILVQSNEGVITINVIAHNSEAMNLLNANLQSIKDNLEQQGIKGEQVEINLANQEKQDNQSGSRYRDQSQAVQLLKKANAEGKYDSFQVTGQSHLLSSALNLLA